MTYYTNLPDVINTINTKLTALQASEMTRQQAFSLLAVMKDRIFVQGKDSNGSQIGTYTPAYVRYARKKANRGTDNKVIISLTRQLENGLHPEALETENGYAIMTRSSEDYDKARWCEETYKKPIFAPTAEERALCQQIAEDYIAKHL